MKPTIEITEESRDKLAALQDAAGKLNQGVGTDWYCLGREHALNEAMRVIDKGWTEAIEQSIQRMKQKGPLTCNS